MKILQRFAVALLFTAASAVQAAPEDVRVYSPGMLKRDQYDVVTRLWVDSWRSAFYVVGRADESQAIAAMKSEAARRGANALTNMACFKYERPLWGSGPHFCYALAIRVKSP